MATIYASAPDRRARSATIEGLAAALDRCPHPWLCLGDWNLCAHESPLSEPAGAFIRGNAAFETPLPRTHRGADGRGRAIDLIIGSGTITTTYRDVVEIGAMDHHLVWYDVPMGKDATLFVLPRCLPLTSEEGRETDFTDSAALAKIEAAPNEGDLDRSWQELSGAAEAMLAADAASDTLATPAHHETKRLCTQGPPPVGP